MTPLERLKKSLERSRKKANDEWSQAIKHQDTHAASYFMGEHAALDRALRTLKRVERKERAGK